MVLLDFVNLCQKQFQEASLSVHKFRTYVIDNEPFIIIFRLLISHPKPWLNVLGVTYWFGSRTCICDWMCRKFSKKVSSEAIEMNKLFYLFLSLKKRQSKNKACNKCCFNKYNGDRKAWCFIIETHNQYRQRCRQLARNSKCGLLLVH